MVVKGGLLDPSRALFCPSRSLVRHQIWFQTPQNGPTVKYLQGCHHWPPFGPFGPSWRLPKGLLGANQAVLRPQTVTNLAFWPLKTSSDGPKWPDLVQNAPYRWSPQVQCILEPIYGLLRPSSVTWGLYSLIYWPFGSPQGGPKGPKRGQWCLLCKHWTVGPLCGVWNQIWCRTRLPEGLKVPCSGQSDPLLTTLDSPWPPLHPPNLPKSPQTLPVTHNH